MGRVIDLLLPRLGETMDEGRIVAWLKQPGERFRRGETVLEVETDKTVVEVPALEDGTLVKIIAPPETTVEVDRPIARIEVAGEAAPAEAEAAPEPARTASAAAPVAAAASPSHATTTAAPAPDRVAASPLARRLARQAGVDIAAIPGTGRRGRVQAADVLARAAGVGEGAPAEVATRLGPVAIRRQGPAPKPGRAATAVLLHGLYGDGDTFLDLARALAAAGRPVIAPDLPTHGRSAAVATRLADLVDATVEAIRAAAGGPVHLVGHSLGAVVATRAALALGPQVRSVLLIAPAGLGVEIDRGFVEGMLGARSREALRRALARLGEDRQPLSDRWIDDQLAAIASRREALAALVGEVAADGVQQVDIAPDLGRLAVPVRAVFGLADRVIPWQHASALPPRVAAHFLPAGHLPHRADPALVAGLLGEG